MCRLLIAFFSGDETAASIQNDGEAVVSIQNDGEAVVTVRRDGDEIVLTVDGNDYELTRDEAVALQSAVGAALTERREFVRTAGLHREDGTYEVTRRGADSAGNSKVFEDFGAVRELFDRLPETFTAEDVGRTGITGSRRHLLVRHFAEHPAFGCTLSRRNPLTGEKQ